MSWVAKNAVSGRETNILVPWGSVCSIENFSGHRNFQKGKKWKLETHTFTLKKIWSKNIAGRENTNTFSVWTRKFLDQKTLARRSKRAWRSYKPSSLQWEFEIFPCNGSAGLRFGFFSKIHINLGKNRMQSLSSGIDRTPGRLSRKNQKNSGKNDIIFKTLKNLFFRIDLIKLSRRLRFRKFTKIKINS